MSDDRPIGILDSGLGGLSLVAELNRLIPHERTIYLGDTARGSFGERSDETVRTFALQGGRYLASKEIKMLVVSCNTISSIALSQLRESIKDIPVIGVVQAGARAAVTRTASRKIGVIGTTATIRSQAYSNAITYVDKRVSVFSKACPQFVSLVDEGLLDHDITRLTAQYYLYELVDAGIDCLILACTHFPLLLNVIQETVGTRVQLLDCAEWTVRETKEILISMDAVAAGSARSMGASQIILTDQCPATTERVQRFLGQHETALEYLSTDFLTTIR